MLTQKYQYFPSSSILAGSLKATSLTQKYNNPRGNPSMKNTAEGCQLPGPRGLLGTRFAALCRAFIPESPYLLTFISNPTTSSDCAIADRWVGRQKMGGAPRTSLAKHPPGEAHLLVSALTVNRVLLCSGWCQVSRIFVLFAGDLGV